MNYFLANKELDFLRGYSEDAVFRNNRMEIQQGAAKAVFFSRMFDSRNEGTVWHRFVAEISAEESAAVRFHIYATESDVIRVRGSEIRIAEYLKDSSIDIKEKKQTLAPLLKKTFYNSNDVILFEVKGRYLFYLCELYARDTVSPGVGDVTLYFPRQTWAEFLPGIYSADPASTGFSERFLAIFQSVYDDMDRKIKESPALMDPMCADRPMLDELAGWFGFNNVYLWPDDKLRILLVRAHEIVKERGTVKCLGDVLEIYLGERPEIVECFDVAKGGNMERQIEYGTDPYRYVVNIKDKYIRSTKDYNALMCIIADNTPAHMSVRLRPVIEPGVNSVNSYLGINTGLGTPDKEGLE